MKDNTAGRIVSSDRRLIEVIGLKHFLLRKYCEFEPPSTLRDSKIVVLNPSPFLNVFKKRVSRNTGMASSDIKNLKVSENGCINSCGSFTQKPLNGSR